MEDFSQYFDYKNNCLYWKSGKLAGWKDKDYQKVQFKNKNYYAHQIIFALHHGYIPKLIDHIDRNPQNNCIENLREANKSQNRQNSKLNKNSLSGIKGVHWSEKAKKWRVSFKVNDKYKSFGYYFDIECAKFIADAMRNKYHGKYAN
jgi:hypothetical protein